MELEFNMDISDESYSFGHTPNLSAQKLPFYVQGFGHYQAGKDYYTKRAGLDNYLLLYTETGVGKLIYRNMERKMEAGQAALINCNERHYYETGDLGYWNFQWIHFGGIACECYHDLINDFSFNIIDMANLENYMEDLNILKKSTDPLIDVKYSAILTNMVTKMLIMKFNTVNSPLNQHIIIVDKVKSFIHENYRNKISLDDLSSIANVSKYHLLRVFKKNMGVSPYEYLINYRINLSKSLLKESGYNVGEASIQVGYNDVNNFIRDFKKYVGTTPLKYKNYWIS
jgi:AraC-like DNA-binding protein